VVRAKGERAGRTQPSQDKPEVLAASALPATQEAEGASPVSGAAIIFVGLFTLGLLMVGASALPPGRVPWAAVGEPLFLHRADLAAFGIGAIALALLCLNIAVLL
jgi:hypothetical protein